MKKLVVLVLSIIFSLSLVGTAFGEGLITMDEEIPESVSAVDLSSMSKDDLIALKKAIDSELLNRGELVSDTFTAGTYTVGRDIKPGVFVFTKQDDGLAAMYVYDNEEKYKSRNPSGQAAIAQGESATFNLMDGMVLSIADFNGIIEEKAAPSWAP